MFTVAEKKHIADYIGFEPVPTAWFTVNRDQIKQFSGYTLDLSASYSVLIDITGKKPGYYPFRTEVIVEIEGSDKPAMTADCLTVQMVA